MQTQAISVAWVTWFSMICGQTLRKAYLLKFVVKTHFGFKYGFHIQRIILGKSCQIFIKIPETHLKNKCVSWQSLHFQMCQIRGLKQYWLISDHNGCSLTCVYVRISWDYSGYSYKNFTTPQKAKFALYFTVFWINNDIL